MKRNLTIASAGAALATLLAGCGGGNSAASGGGSVSMSPPPATPTYVFSTQDVLTLARSTSELQSPLAVADGNLVLTDTSETSTPLQINTM